MIVPPKIVLVQITNLWSVYGSRIAMFSLELFIGSPVYYLLCSFFFFPLNLALSIVESVELTIGVLDGLMGYFEVEDGATIK